MKKKVFSLLLTLVLVLSLLPFSNLQVQAATSKVAYVKGVGAGVEYDSTKGTFVPVFRSLKAYDTSDKAINVNGLVQVTDLHTGPAFTRNNVLTEEPQKGETYYFSIYVDQYLDGVDYGYQYSTIKSKTNITLNGFEVELYSFMEREMGSYLDLRFSATMTASTYDTRYQITEVEISMPNLESFPKEGEAVKSPYYTIKSVKGDTNFSTDAVALHFQGGEGYKNTTAFGWWGKASGESSWRMGEKYQVGSYRFAFLLSQKDTENHKLSDNLVVKVNGKKCEFLYVYQPYNDPITSDFVEVYYDRTLVMVATPEIKCAPHTCTPGSTFVTDEHYHWKVCTFCGGVISSTKATHGGGKATCRSKAACSACGTFYGGITDHEWTETWDHSDAKGHYHSCTTPGCDQRSPVAAHNPDRYAALEDADKKCVDCGFVIEPAKGHIHADHLSKVDAVAATCSSTGSTEYYLCSCGKYFKDSAATVEYQNGETDVILPRTEHVFAGAWKVSPGGHWKVCECGEWGSMDNHADENGDVKCDTCDYVLGTAIPDTTEPDAEEPDAEESEATQSDTSSPTQQEEDKSGGMPWWIIVLIVVAAVGAGVLVFLLVKRNTGTAPETDVTPDR